VYNGKVKKTGREMTLKWINNQKLQSTLELATMAHAGQQRKYTGEPYIVHPTSVAIAIEREGGTESQIAAALLHDVVEDTEVSAGQLRARLHQIWGAVQADEIFKMVIELTDVYTKQDFPELNRRARKLLEAQRLSRVSDQAKQIKLQDIADNKRSIELDPNFAKVWNQEADQIINHLKG
jgi:(p)ppGpp synthase/HD superfamily hydrolase